MNKNRLRKKQQQAETRNIEVYVTQHTSSSNFRNFFFGFLLESAIAVLVTMSPNHFLNSQTQLSTRELGQMMSADFAVGSPSGPSTKSIFRKTLRFKFRISQELNFILPCFSRVHTSAIACNDFPVTLFCQNLRTLKGTSISEYRKFIPRRRIEWSIRAYQDPCRPPRYIHSH